MTFEDIIGDWVEDFIEVLHPNPDIGDAYLSAPSGIKIIFDGYGEEDAANHMSFAVFVHMNSLTEEFPEHDHVYGLVQHRSKEEVCIYVWYNPDTQDVFVNVDNFENEYPNHEEYKELVKKIWLRDNGSED